MGITDRPGDPGNTIPEEQATVETPSVVAVMTRTYLEELARVARHGAQFGEPVDEVYLTNAGYLASVRTQIAEMGRLDQDALTAYFGLDGSEPLAIHELARHHNLKSSQATNLVNGALGRLGQKLYPPATSTDV